MAADTSARKKNAAADCDLFPTRNAQALRGRPAGFDVQEPSCVSRVLEQPT
jgi:hypothetical protein